MSDSVPRQCLHILNEDPANLNPPSSWLPRLSAEQMVTVPFKGQAIPSKQTSYVRNKQC